MKIKKTISILFILAVIVVIVVFFATKKTKSIYTTTDVVRGDIVQTVSETGTVKSESDIDLSFLSTGKINKIDFNVGDSVEKDQIIAELDYSGLIIKKEEAQASIDVRKNDLAKLLAGATKEDILISEANVVQAKNAYNVAVLDLENVRNTTEENKSQIQKTLDDLLSDDPNDITSVEQSIVTAQTDLDNVKSTYQEDVNNSINDALISLDDKLVVVNNALDAINSVLTDEDGENLIGVINASYLKEAKTEYDNALGLLGFAKSSLGLAKADQSNGYVEDAVDDGMSVVNEVYSALKNCYSALENSVTSSQFTQTKLDALKTSISAEQTLTSSAISKISSVKQDLDNAILFYNTNVSSAEDRLAQARATYNDAVINSRNSLSSVEISNDQVIFSAKTRIDSAMDAWNVAKAQLEKTKSSASIHDINLVKAQIRQAEASLDAVKKNIEDSILRSPISGIITRSNYIVGEQVMTGQSVVSVLGKNNFEIEVLISEADIAKVKKGDVVFITLDAFGEGVIFNGLVDFIEPAETVVQDVIYYKANIVFTDKENSYKIKSGMTANVIITTAKKKNVLLVPNRAILSKESGDKILRILVDKEIIEKEITTGLRGDGGFVEVLSGVKEGETIVTRITEK